MIYDSLGYLSQSQAVTATAESTYYVDLGVAGRDVGTGEQLYVVVVVNTEMDSAGEAATLTIALQTDTEVTFTGATTLLSTRAYAESTLTAGRAPIVIPIPMGDAERYMRLYYTVGTESFTTGNIDAFITTGVQTNL